MTACPACGSVIDWEVLELTPTEKKIARLVRDGMHMADVAAELKVTVRTIKAHLSNLYRKLGVDGMVDLAIVTNLNIPLDSPLRVLCLQKNQA